MGYGSTIPGDRLRVHPLAWFVRLLEDVAIRWAAIPDEIYSRIVELRRTFHRRPELAFEEEYTAQVIMNELDRLGIPYDYGGKGGEVVGRLAGTGAGTTLALGAEMDALPVACEAVNDIRWDIRPRPQLGSLEIRVMDAQSTVSEAVALAGFVRALAAYLAATPSDQRPPEMPVALPWWTEKDNDFVASRLALNAKYIKDDQGNVGRVKDQFHTVAAAIEKAADALDQGVHLQRVRSMVENGPSYVRQRAVHKAPDSFEQAVAALIEELDKDTRP